MDKLHRNNYLKKGYVDKNEFDHLLNSIGIKNDQNLNNRLFWVSLWIIKKLFDLNGNGVVEPQEISMAINMFREQTFEEKVAAFFNHCDETKSGFIDDERVFKFMRKNLKTIEEVNVLRMGVKDFAIEMNPSDPKKITLFINH